MKRELKAKDFRPKPKVDFRSRVRPYEEGTESLTNLGCLIFSPNEAEFVPMKRELKDMEARILSARISRSRVRPYEEGTERVG